MVEGVAGCVGDEEAEHLLPARERAQVLLGHRRHLTPEPIHLVAVELAGAGEKLGGIGQVTGAAPVDVDGQLREAPHQAARGARVVEVDVGEQEGAWLLAAESRQQRPHAQLGPGVDQDSVQLPAADHPRVAQMLDVDQPHRRALPQTGWRGRPHSSRRSSATRSAPLIGIG